MHGRVGAGTAQGCAGWRAGSFCCRKGWFFTGVSGIAGSGTDRAGGGPGHGAGWRCGLPGRWAIGLGCGQQGVASWRRCDIPGSVSGIGAGKGDLQSFPGPHGVARAPCRGGGMLSVAWEGTGRRVANPRVYWRQRLSVGKYWRICSRACSGVSRSSESLLNSSRYSRQCSIIWSIVSSLVKAPSR